MVRSNLVSHSTILKIAAGVAILFLAGIILSVQIMAGNEAKKNIQDIRDRGTYLVNLLSLYPLNEFVPERRSFF